MLMESLRDGKRHASDGKRHVSDRNRRIGTGCYDVCTLVGALGQVVMMCDGSGEAWGTVGHGVARGGL